MHEVCLIGDIANKYIDETAPWVLAKDESRSAELDEVLATIADVVKCMSIMFKPVLVTKADKVLDALKVAADDRNHLNICLSNYCDNKEVSLIEPLFPRLKREDEVEFLVGMIDN